MEWLIGQAQTVMEERLGRPPCGCMFAPASEPSCWFIQVSAVVPHRLESMDWAAISVSGSYPIYSNAVTTHNTAPM